MEGGENQSGHKRVDIVDDSDFSQSIQYLMLLTSTFQHPSIQSSGQKMEKSKETKPKCTTAAMLHWIF